MHYAEEVDHLIAKRCKVACGGGGNFARNSAKTLLNQLFKRPTRTVACEHGKVVDMYVRIAVRVCDFVIVNLAQPVVSGDCARVAEDKTADRVCNGGVFLNTPVVDFYIVVHNLLIVKNGGLHVTHFFMQASVENVRLCHIRISSLNKH